MKKKFVAVALVAVIAVPGFADMKSEWQKKYDAYCAASIKKDMKAVEKSLRAVFAEDFKFIPKKGETVNLKQWIEKEKTEASMTEKVNSFSIKIESLKEGKDTATMKVSIHFSGKVKMSPGAKTSNLLKFDGTADQKLVKRSGRWWVVEMKEGDMKTTLDGKPFDGG
ncbi:MAG: hypothetical protein JST12_20885 [Armatimonadetes bacterium]|nr:hypothetical protein [Armatimonadota bacterium]